MQGELIDIGTYEDEFHNKFYRITIEFETKPPFKLGGVEVKENG